MTNRASFVIDCSMTMAWCFSDERTPRTDAILDLLKTETAIVPGLWALEVANVLVVAERRGRLQVTQTTQFAEALKSLPIEFSLGSIESCLDDILALARNHKLSSYDAAYLHLALSTGLPLATLDRDLSLIASSLGIQLL